MPQKGNPKWALWAAGFIGGLVLVISALGGLFETATSTTEKMEGFWHRVSTFGAPREAVAPPKTPQHANASSAPASSSSVPPATPARTKEPTEVASAPPAESQCLANLFGTWKRDGGNPQVVKIYHQDGCYFRARMETENYTHELIGTLLRKNIFDVVTSRVNRSTSKEDGCYLRDEITFVDAKRYFFVKKDFSGSCGVNWQSDPSGSFTKQSDSI